MESQVERGLTSYEDGSFLIDRLGAGMVVDQDLAVVLLDFRRRFKDEYGDTPAVMMQIDRAVVAYRDFLRVTGWGGILPSISSTSSSDAMGPAHNFEIGTVGRVARSVDSQWKSTSPICVKG